jgi:hypothetical protein
MTRSPRIAERDLLQRPIDVKTFPHLRGGGADAKGGLLPGRQPGISGGESQGRNVR